MITPNGGVFGRHPNFGSIASGGPVSVIDGTGAVYVFVRIS
jgi:hypothetical protein